MCALEKYNCHICPAGKMRDLLIAHRGDYKKTWLAASQNFAKRYDVETLSSVDFFGAYEKSCVVREKAQRSTSDFPQRKELCENCPAVQCGHCKKPGCYQSNDSCQDCSKYPESFDDEASANVGQKCFFYKDFQKVIHITLNANEDVLDPRGNCEQCLYCTAEENGTESIVLQDLPLEGHPTEVTVIRKLYARKHGGSKLNGCPRLPLPGLQKTLNSRFTCRLYAACISAALKAYSFQEISEWYNISDAYLRKMKKEQAERVEERKSLLREKLRLGESCVGSEDAKIEGCTYRMYFYVPAYPGIPEKGALELAGIYSKEEQDYLTNLLTCTILKWCESHLKRPDISTSRVFSMAYDYAATQYSGVSAPAVIFALVVAMADSFLCAPLAQVAYEFSALHRQMTQLVQKGGSIRELLALAESTSNLIPDLYSDSTLVAYTNRLILQLKDMLCGNEDQTLESLRERPKAFRPEELIKICDIVNLISECMKSKSLRNNSSVPFDQLREDILFFNQTVIPYKFNIHQNKLLPQLDPYGDIDTSAINSIGIRCSCLEHIIRPNLWSDGPFALRTCKDELFEGQYHLQPCHNFPLCDGSHCPELTIEQ